MMTTTLLSNIHVVARERGDTLETATSSKGTRPIQFNIAIPYHLITTQISE